MIEVRNDIIPFKGNKAMTVWPFVFIRAKYMSADDMRHEYIHGIQQWEMLPVAIGVCMVLWVIGCGWWSLLALPLYFYVYGLLYLWVLIGGSKNPYRDNPLEQEAYMFQGDEGYLQRRPMFAWWYFLTH